ncbi:MAG: HlyD family efflux transporter periplasmic adaptor subunit, partial [Blautia producta]
MSERNHFFQRIKRIFTGLKRLLTYNIATIMFGALLLYMIITVVLYATSSHVTSYQVTVGPLTKNPVCTGLALRKEQIVPAGASGYVEYYAREGMQVRKDGSVYALTNNKKEPKSVELSEEQLEKMRSNMANFSYGFSGSDFYDAYSFKYELQGSILQAAGIMEQKTETEKKEEHTDSNALIGEEVGNTVSLGKQTVYTAPEAGVVVYSTDGYEGITEENITEDAFNEKSYKKTDLLTSKELAAGDPVYKVITSENWTLMVPLTDKLAAALSGRESIKVKFTKDGESQNGSLAIVQVGNQKVAKIQLQNGMPRYASDRFLEVELVINTQSGLKIPLSSVVEKEFYVIPRDFLAQGNNGEGKGFIREVD